MQSRDSQSFTEAHSLCRPTAAASGVRCVPPGALAGYLQAQQAWRRRQTSIEQSCSKLTACSYNQSTVSNGSHSSCSTSEQHFRPKNECAMPALGRKAVAKLFEQRHELLSQHRHQRQAAKRRRVKPCSIDTAASLLSLPEDVLLKIVYNLSHEDIGPLFEVCQELRSMMHTAMMLHFTYVTPHRHVDELYGQRAMAKKRPALRAPPATSSTNRAQQKTAAPRALQFQESSDNSEVISCIKQLDEEELQG